MSESVIISGFSPIFTGWLCAPCKSALCVVPVMLNLIFDCLGFKLAVAVYGGLPIEWPFFYVSYISCVPVCSSDVI